MTGKAINFVGILAQQSKEFILSEYWHNSQRKSFMWILTQQSNEFILCEYWHNSQRNSFCVDIGTTVKGIHFV